MDIAEWTGPVGDVWAQEWRRTDRSFADLATHLDAAILAAAPAGAFDALDIGCGAGATSLALARSRPDAKVCGIDVSPALIGIATKRAAGLAPEIANVSFAVGDAGGDGAGAGAGAGEAVADLLVSRHGVMFFADPAAAFARLRAAARPGARLVFSCFRRVAENPFAGALVAAVAGNQPVPPPGYSPGPFAFADPGFVTAILAGAGWHDASATRVDFAYVAGEGAEPVADAVGFFRRIGPVAAAMRGSAESPATLVARLEAALAGYRSGDRITLPAAAWIWQARA